MKAETIVAASAPEVFRYITEYSVGPSSEPNAIATDEAGNVWFTLGRPAGIGELTPANGTLHEFLMPSSSSNGSSVLLSWGIVVDNTLGRVWFTINLATRSGAWTFTLEPSPSTICRTCRALPTKSRKTKKGNIWFTEVDGNRLGEMSANGTLHEFPIPLGATYNAYSRSVGPAGMDIGGDGTIWFAEVYANSLGSFKDGGFHSFDLSGKIKSPTGISIDATGKL